MHDHAAMSAMSAGGAAWLGGAASFLGMWIAMTAAMMLPSVAPVLWRYRRAVAASHAARPSRSALLAGAAYLAVWSAIGVILLPLGVARPALWHPDPLGLGLVVLLAGVLQQTSWSAHSLERCAPAHAGRAARSDDAAAWRYGLVLGWRCAISCAAPMAALVAAHVMDARVMAAMTAAIALGRFAPEVRARLTRPA